MAESNKQDKAKTDIRSTEKYNKFIKELRAKRLDQVDACNISDPSGYIAPCGCHYSSNDISQTKSYYPECDDDTILKMLSGTTRYKELPSNALSIDISDKAIIAWGTEKGFNISDEYKASVGIPIEKNNAGTGSTDEETIRKAKAQRVSTPTDAVTQVTPGSAADAQFGQTGVKGEQLKKDEYVPWLCKLFNEICRADTSKPQIPTSVAVSISLAITGADTSNIGKYNFWKLPYDKTISNLGGVNNECGFSTDSDGARGCLVYAHRCTNELMGLADKMEDSTEDNKQKVTLSLIAKLDPSKSTDLYKSALDYVTKYSLRDWDTNKKENEGGHADTKKDDKSQANNNIQNALNKVIEQVNYKEGVGFRFIPRGSDYTEVIKLPENKTPCEPIYPDFIEVGDTVPDWVFSQTYAQTKKEIQENQAATATLTGSANNEKQKQLESVNQEIEKFKENQFVKWIQKEGLKYTNEEEKKIAEVKYKEAADSDKDHFIDGIYIPNNDDKTIYNTLIKKKNDLTGDIGSNVDKKEKDKETEKKDKATDKDKNEQKPESKPESDEKGQPADTGDKEDDD